MRPGSIILIRKLNNSQGIGNEPLPDAEEIQGVKCSIYRLPAITNINKSVCLPSPPFIDVSKFGRKGYGVRFLGRRRNYNGGILGKRSHYYRLLLRRPNKKIAGGHQTKKTRQTQSWSVVPPRQRTVSQSRRCDGCHSRNGDYVEK
ncbi:unnamed protein product [Pieris macdunnoughi]|uniref:Uncharacterized protein n=1 Tax=Pieris macdunnoughi TaxID=345717 RepID=A0A821XKZ2_9NEOP|nr:unnamed protein product [Pieris macdunnoughi]